MKTLEETSFWWAPTNGDHNVPTFMEVRICPSDWSDVEDPEEWRAMREQLWAIREGLA